MNNENKIVAVRFSVSDIKLFKKIAKNRVQDVSDFVRLLVKKELARLSFLSAGEKKALEVLKEE